MSIPIRCIFLLDRRDHLESRSMSEIRERQSGQEAAEKQESDRAEGVHCGVCRSQVAQFWAAEELARLRCGAGF
jgi:hypothetical protein